MASAVSGVGAKGEKISVNEKKFIQQAANLGQRIDGRRPFDYRKLKFTTGRLPGHVEVQLGRTRVYGVVTAEIIEPWPDRPTEGFLNINTEISPMASPHFETGRASDMAIEVGRVIERTIRGSRALDTEALCIIAGVKVWSLRVDLNVLDYDGNIIDCATAAALASLVNFRREEVTVSGNTVTVHPVTEKDPVPLSIHHLPVCVTFAILDDGELLLDPSLKEETVMEGRLTIALNAHRELCLLHKAGGVPVPSEDILKCAKIAAVRSADITEKLNEVKAQSCKKSTAQAAVLGVDVQQEGDLPSPSTLKTRPAKESSSLKDSPEEDNAAGDVSAEEEGSTEKMFEGGNSAWDQDRAAESRSEDKRSRQEEEPMDLSAAIRKKSKKKKAKH